WHRWRRPGPAGASRRQRPGRWRSGTEEAIAVVAQPGKDVLLGVQLTVPGRRENLHVRVGGLQRLDSFRGRHDAYQANACRLVFLHDLDRLERGPSGGEHGVENHDSLALDVGRQLHVIPGGYGGSLVAPETDLAHRHLWQQLE